MTVYLLAGLMFSLSISSDWLLRRLMPRLEAGAAVLSFLSGGVM